MRGNIRGGIVGRDMISGRGRLRLRLRRCRIEPYGAIDVGGYNGDLVGVAKGEVGVDEDEDVRYGFGEGQLAV